MKINSNQEAFFTLLRAGLWEKEVRLKPFGTINFTEIRRLAEEQSVIGLISAGLEQVIDTKVPRKVFSPFIGQTIEIEQMNSLMNYYLCLMVEKMRGEGIYVILVKGQGVAQCYMRPLWRSSGDIDFLLDNTNYSKAQLFYEFITGKTSQSDTKSRAREHLEYNHGPWLVEIHGNMNTGLSRRIDRVIGEVQDNVFIKGEVRAWRNEGTDILLPSPDNDVIFIFAHILQHFFQGGVGLRQLCDLSRLLWTYRETIDRDLLKERLLKMDLMTEWKAIACYCVVYLGMPVEAMPLYESGKRWIRKANRINSFVLDVGNFGHNKDYSYFTKYPPIIRKLITSWHQTKESFQLSLIFPLDSLIFLFHFYMSGIKNIFSK